MDFRPDDDYWFSLIKMTATPLGTTYWQDGNPSTYRWWGSTDPNENVECIRYTQTGFKDRPCSLSFQYTCKMAAGRPTVYELQSSSTLAIQLSNIDLTAMGRIDLNGFSERKRGIRICRCNFQNSYLRNKPHSHPIGIFNFLFLSWHSGS